MTELERAQRSIFSITRQASIVSVRRKALATLRPGDAVQFLDRETGEPTGTRALLHVDRTRELCGATIDDWPMRYVAGEWKADDDGNELNEWFEHVEGGRILVRCWDVRPEPEPQKPRFSWALYEAHMEDVHAAITSGNLKTPEAPWE